MQNIRTFHAATIGLSHVKKNMPCQDAAGDFEDLEKGIYIGAVSDGHGSKDYFRSDRGSKLLVETSIEILKTFAYEMQDPLFQEDFVTRNTLTSLQSESLIESAQDSSLSSSVLYARKKSEEAINHIVKTVISRWQEAIEKDWSEDLPSEDFMREKGVPESMLKQYLNNNNIAIAYGCTLLAFLKTHDYWFAFQLGDGKCIAFDEGMTPFLPIPDDEQCVGNVTTSMCEPNAFENFRFAYGKKKINALFLGSDGLDGRHGDMDDYTIPRLIEDYVAIVKTFLKHGFDEGYQLIKDAFPVWSKNDNNARDDMSLAGWIDLSDKETNLHVILTQEKNEIKKKLEEAQKRIETEEKELEDYDANILNMVNEIKINEEKGNTLMSKLNESKSKEEELQQKIMEEKTTQTQLEAAQNELTHNKKKLEIELNELKRVRENKNQKIIKEKDDIEKNRSTLQRISNELEGSAEASNNMNEQFNHYVAKQENSNNL